jgi:hypothetical protein
VSLLGRTWGLHDVEDVEKFVSKALDDSLRKRNAFLRPHEREDAIAFLLSVMWELSERWEPERAPSFATFAYRTLRLRVVDFYRQEYGRTRWEWKDSVYERGRPPVLSLDGGDPVVDAVTRGGGDDAADRLAALAGLHDLGSGAVDRDLETLRRMARRRAAA